MVIAADYPFLDILWTMIIFFAWVVWIWMMIAILTDVFRRRDIGGWAKAGWTVFLIVIPFLAALIYLIAEHKGMTERTISQQQAAQAQMDQYVKSVASTSDPTAQIANAKALLDQGTISQAEFDQIKQKALAG